MTLGVAFHRTYARQTATVDLGASYILTAQAAQSLKLSISGPIAIIFGVIGGVFSMQGAPPAHEVSTLTHAESPAVARGQAVGSSRAVASSCFHLSSRRILTGSLLLCNYNAT